eukprot:CAMPEP_0170169840 /NCGR_PEP_ID=MMETSP0040_2-20121228/2780_1 /TAXON_ID=641309 /ORGANISM="Lotharella oceanica, Strain CCMP622" /LENGTH=157 /DNA_ID=CAMNT_0010408825 /DNA_START=63 /DNA_END=536 /DNA_ORIENTATION=+
MTGIEAQRLVNADPRNSRQSATRLSISAPRTPSSSMSAYPLIPRLLGDEHMQLPDCPAFDQQARRFSYQRKRPIRWLVETKECYGEYDPSDSEELSSEALEEKNSDATSPHLSSRGLFELEASPDRRSSISSESSWLFSKRHHAQLEISHTESYAAV